MEYIKIGEALKARDLFKEILTESPDYIGSYYHLAKCLVDLQEIEQAIQWYEKGMAAAKLAKDDHAYRELLAAMKTWSIRLNDHLISYQLNGKNLLAYKFSNYQIPLIQHNDLIFSIRNRVGKLCGS